MPYKSSEKARARRKAYYKEHKKECLAYSRAYNKRNAEDIAGKRKMYQVGYKERCLKQYLVSAAKFRAKKRGISFDLSPDDFEIPDICPVFGRPFEQGTKKYHPWSPSLDRIKPELGYIKGNVEVISFRANELKGNASLKELEQVVSYVRRVTQKC